MKYSIRFGSSSIASMDLKQQDFEVGSLLGIISFFFFRR